MTRRVRHALVLAGVVSTLIPAWRLAPIPPAAAQLEQLVARVKPAVVLIQVKKALGGRAHGSGFMYDASGLILTNHHVVEGATEIVVTLPDGRSFPASVVDYHREVRYNLPDLEDFMMRDVAVLKITASRLPVLPIVEGFVSVQQGQEILILGYPGGVATDQVSVTRGIVSAIRGGGPWFGGRGWIQTDAVMAPGNSGGPAIDRQGRVIGLATFGTGYFRRIGGIVSHNSYIPVAARARLRNAERERTLYVTGMEYVQLPKSREHVQLPPSWEVENFNGALRYRIFKRHAWPSDDQSYYIDSTGLYYLGGTVYYKTPWDSFEATFRWQRKPPQPILLFRFPPVAGDSWEVEDHWTPGGGLLARPLGSEELRPIAVKGRVKVDSVNEVVTVPAGTFDKCIKITQDLELATMRAGRGERARLIKTTWYAGTVGAVRVVGRLAGMGGWTREWTRELTGDTLLPE